MAIDLTKLFPISQPEVKNQYGIKLDKKDIENNTMTEGGGLFGFLNPASIGGLLGLGNALLQPLVSTEDPLRRIREKEVNEALSQNLSNRNRLLQQSPEASRQMQAMALQRGRQGALAQAGAVGGGLSGQTGFAGGDIASGNIAGIKASAPVMQASAPYDQALAQTYANKEQQVNTINQQLAGNTMDRGKLAEMTAYLDNSQANPYNHLLSMILGGANAGTNFGELMSYFGAGQINKPKTETKTTN